MTKNQQKSDFTVLYVLGSGHCGSTLLNLLLNGHSQMLGLSEIHSVSRYIALDDMQDNPLRTPFWKKIIECYEVVTGLPFAKIDLSPASLAELRSWGTVEVTQWARSNYYLLSCIVRQSGASIIIDTSKFWQRLYLLQESEFFDIKVIHLVRDGRAVINSYIRKYDNFRLAFRRWIAPSLAAFYLRHKFKETDWLRVKYERLAVEPRITLQDICAFLNVDFEPAMLSYRKHSYIGIGGNRMLKCEDEQIFLDERWKRELARIDLIRFILLGGWLNKYYGY